MSQREINQIIVHCSASEWGDASEIDKWHKERGWDCIGYHYVILNGTPKYNSVYQDEDDGKIEIGRPIEKIGAHCKGQNKDSIGICLIGTHWFTLEQFDALQNLIDDLQAKYGCDVVYGHHHYNQHKTCPNFDVEQLAGIV